MWYNYLWWVPLVCLFYVGYAWLSIKNNSSNDLKYMWILYGYGAAIQLWAIVSKISKNLMFDNFLYDFLMTISIAAVLILMRNLIPTPMQITGLILCIAGLALLR
jgi:hypothetical protein